MQPDTHKLTGQKTAIFVIKFGAQLLRTEGRINC